MNGCIYCTDAGRCEKFSNGVCKSFCVLPDAPCGYKTPSNGDKIRAMTDEQLAIMLRQTQEDVILAGGVYPDWLGLLKAEVKDDRD